MVVEVEGLVFFGGVVEAVGTDHNVELVFPEGHCFELADATVYVQRFESLRLLHQLLVLVAVGAGQQRNVGFNQNHLPVADSAMRESTAGLTQRRIHFVKYFVNLADIVTELVEALQKRLERFVDDFFFVQLTRSHLKTASLDFGPDFWLHESRIDLVLAVNNAGTQMRAF